MKLQWKKAIYRKRVGAVEKLSLPMGQVKGQGLDIQRNPCGKSEVMGVGLNHRQPGSKTVSGKRDSSLVQ